MSFFHGILPGRLSKQHFSRPDEVFFLFFHHFHTLRQNFLVGFSNIHPACPLDFCERNCFCFKKTKILFDFIFGNPQNCLSFLVLPQRFFQKDCQNCPKCVQRNVLWRKFVSSVSSFERKFYWLLARNKNYSQFFPKQHSECGDGVWQKFSRIFFSVSNAGFPNWIPAVQRKLLGEKYLMRIFFFIFLLSVSRRVFYGKNL